MKVQCMQNFQDAVKRQMLRSTVQTGNTLADLAMGRADDLNKWISSNVSYVFGCDVAAASINDPDTGAYRKVLDKRIALGSRESVPPMTFVVADAARILKTGEAGLSGEDQGLLRSEFAGRAASRPPASLPGPVSRTIPWRQSCREYSDRMLARFRGE